MDAPPNAAADTFAEEMALGTEQPSVSPTDRIREDLPVERSSSALPSSGSPGPTGGIASATDAVSAMVSGATEAVTGKVPSATGTGTKKALAVAARIKEWVSAHPLVVVGAGLVGGIVLGGSGGGSNHHHYGDAGSQGHVAPEGYSASRGDQSSNR